MTTGLKIPLSVDKQGKAIIVEASDYIRQIIVTSLRNCESRNPFQDLGLGESMIFDVNDETTKIKIQIRIEEIFARLEVQELAKLGSSSTANSLIFEQTEEGELNLIIKYVDLENDVPQELSIPLTENIGA